MAVAFDFTRVALYDANMTRTDVLSGEMEQGEKAYRWLIRPIYTVFPKPGELSDLVRYVVSADDTKAGLLGGRKKLNVWQPLWSSLAFMVAILALSCVYVSRKDF